MREKALTHRRALRLDVKEVRAGREAVAPLAGKFPAWHSSTALLAARLNRTRRRGGMVADMLPDIDALALRIKGEIDEWDAGLNVADATGHVADAKRSMEWILNSLVNLRTQAQRSVETH